MNVNHFNYNSMEEILSQLGLYLKEKNKIYIPEKEKFFQDLNDKILKNKERTIYHKTKYLEPITNFWEQLFYGKKNYSYLISSFAILFFIVSILFYQYQYNWNQNQPTLEEDVPVFGVYPLEESEKMYTQQFFQEDLKEEERELLNSYLNEENPEEKQKILIKLLEYYKKTNQEEKIKKLMELLD